MPHNNIWVGLGANSDGKMTSNDDSPNKWCDRYVKLYTQIYCLGPLDLVNMSIINTTLPNPNLTSSNLPPFSWLISQCAVKAACYTVILIYWT